MKLTKKSTEPCASGARDGGANALGALGAFVCLLMLVSAWGCSDRPTPTPAALEDPSDADAALTLQASESIRTSTTSPSFIQSSPPAPLPPFTPTASAPSSAPTVSGAGSPGEATAARPAESPTQSPPQDDPTDRPLYASVDGAEVEGGEIGTIFNLADVRVGRHDGYTRIVWEMEEAEGRPYHRVVTRVREDGSPVQPFGRHWLEISISDVYAWSRPELLESRTVALDGAVTVLQQLMIGDDAIYSVGVGLDGPVRFELSLLEEPVRLVLDVFDDGR